MGCWRASATNWSSVESFPTWKKRPTRAAPSRQRMYGARAASEDWAGLLGSQLDRLDLLALPALRDDRLAGRPRLRTQFTSPNGDWTYC